MRENRTFDSELELTDAGAIIESAAGLVDESAQIIDVGTGKFDGTVVIDVTAITINDRDELYQIAIQGSSDSAFADTYESLAILELGNADVLVSDVDSTVGRYMVPFSNERNGTNYQYIRIYTTISGTSPSITMISRIGK